LAERAAAGPREYLGGEIARDDLDAPARELGKGLAEQHGDAVRLLPAGARRTPHREPALAAAPGEEFGQDRPAQRLEGVNVTEERGLVGGHGLDHLAVQAAETLATQAGHELAERAHPFALGEREEP